MSSDFISGRVEAVRWDLLNSQLELIRQLDTVSAGDLTWSVSADIGGTGSATWTPDGTSIDWDTAYLRCWYLRDEADPEPLITAAVNAPQTDHSRTRASLKLGLLDVTTVLAEDSFRSWYGVEAGAVVTSKIADIIESTGWSRYVIEPSAATLAAPLAWDPDTSKLRIVNDLLAAINYWAIDADPMGTLIARPYQPPEQRGEAWSFSDGSNSILLPDWTATRDTYRVPNRLSVIQKVEGEATPATAVATLDALMPDSRLTFARRGRWVTRVVSEVDAPADALQARANRLLLDAQNVAGTITVKHPWLPNVRTNSVVTHNHRRGGGGRGVIQRQAMSLSVPMLVESTIMGLS